MKREKYDKATSILERIEELEKQANFLKLYDHCGLMLYPAAEIDEPKESRFGLYLDKESLKMVYENKQKEIKNLEKQFEEL